jgi:hypothetical protein
MMNADMSSAFGLPWEVIVIQVDPNVSILAYTKGGKIAPYSSFVAVIPDLDIAVAALIGVELDETSLCRQVRKRFYSFVLCQGEETILFFIINDHCF